MLGLVKLFKLAGVSTVAIVYVLEFVPFELLTILITVTLFKDEIFTSSGFELFVLIFEEIVAFVSVLSLLFFGRDEGRTEVLTYGVEGIEGIDGIEGIEGIGGIEGIEGIDGIDGIEGIGGIDGVGGTGEIYSIFVDLEFAVTCWRFDELVVFSNVKLLVVFEFF